MPLRLKFKTSTHVQLQIAVNRFRFHVPTHFSAFQYYTAKVKGNIGTNWVNIYYLLISRHGFSCKLILRIPLVK